MAGRTRVLPVVRPRGRNRRGVGLDAEGRHVDGHRRRAARFLERRPRRRRRRPRGVGGDDATGVQVALQALQIGLDVARRLVAALAILLEQPADDVLERRDYVRVDCARRHRHAVQDRSKITAVVWPLNGRTPVAISYITTPNEKRSLRRPRPRRGPARATCRRRCPGLCPGPVEVLLGDRASRSRRPPRCGTIFGEAEVEHLAWPRLVTKMLAGLMSRWTMPGCARRRGRRRSSIPRCR